MVVELGTTTDPRALILGYPDAIRTTATAMADYGHRLQEAGTGLKRINTTEGWAGTAADEFRAAFDGEPTKWLQAGDCFDTAAQALHRHSDTLMWAQRQAAEAITLWNEGEAATNYAQSEHGHDSEQTQQQRPNATPSQPPLSDPGAAKKHHARDILERARSSVASSGEHAADVVSRARDQAPKRHWVARAGEALGQAAGPALNGIASVGNAALNHPEMVLGAVGGGALAGVSLVGETAGVALDATGAGAVAGVPLGAVSTAGLVTGGGIMAASMAGLGAEAAGDDQTEVVDTNESDTTDESVRDQSTLSSSDRRSVESYERLINEHEDKLEAYRNDPDAFDNKGILENAPNDEIRQRIIDGRIRHLENEIQTFRDNIDKIYKGAQ